MSSHTVKAMCCSLLHTTMGETIRCEDCGKVPWLELGASGDRMLRCDCIDGGGGPKFAYALDETPGAWSTIDNALQNIPEKARVDYIACVEKGESYNGQARKRGVAHTTVMANVERAKEALGE